MEMFKTSGKSGGNPKFEESEVGLMTAFKDEILAKCRIDPVKGREALHRMVALGSGSNSTGPKADRRSPGQGIQGLRQGRHGHGLGGIF